MWTTNWRDTVWSQLDREFDLIIIGGGITGAGILREAARAGLSAVLFEQHDFASGTSSRSSKLVHGGLRYLRNAQIKLTYESVHERERLLKEGRGLVSPLPFLMANYAGDKIPAWVFGFGLSLYDLLALKWNHKHYSPAGLRELCPQLTSPEMICGYRYFDAQTDDARLVLRVILEATKDGALALNYARVEGLLKAGERACGVAVRDCSTDGSQRRLAPGSVKTTEVRARAVINATGAWADESRGMVGGRERLRVLRGSHLFFPSNKLSLTRAVTFLHPQDSRPVFVVPWEGVTLVGTTDVDHAAAPATDLRISDAEAEYLMNSVTYAFPGLVLSLADVQSTLAGMRAVVDSGKANPSKESREFVLWNENGLLTVSGGKLTTFRLMAQQALRAIRPVLPEHARLGKKMRGFDPLPDEMKVCGQLEASMRLRLVGRYGSETCHLMAAAQDGELKPIGESLSLWAELRWAARAEDVVHLDDLLARRLRLAITLPGGGLNEMAKIRAIVQPELGWDDARWEEEEKRYRALWQAYYLPP
ncbi:MAG: glycerol-3-phosphate dehydrogenase/oxidase [Anaerolineales bacterium]|nr:glycerol-3-phosphate dehydrogenase/oxidase [Anaerolineales bacterium]